MANRFPEGGERTASYRKAIVLDPSSSAIAEGPTDAIMVDIPAGSSPSAIVVDMGGHLVSMNNLSPGIVYPFRISRLTAAPGNGLVTAFYY